MKDTVDLGHSGYRAYRSESRRARAERRPPPELTGVLAREWAARLPEHDVTGLLRELVVSVNPADGTALRWARSVPARTGGPAAPRHRSPRRTARRRTPTCTRSGP
ncbi:hypothetical protein ACFYT5_00135 [Streptomyces anulatus]|uniref:Uncharacterized protein n=1 Tax=Streptomyces anulatus TaxID=1892 RepID=A0ABZ1ZWM7_STRAQ|nr:hypothetical protein [Streptomyces anulatus]